MKIPRINPRDLVHKLGGFWDRDEGFSACPRCQPGQPLGCDQLRVTVCQPRAGFDVTCENEGCHPTDILAEIAKILPNGKLKTKIIHLMAIERWEQEQASFNIARDHWSKAVPLAGTLGENYFRSIGITACLPSSLRWEQKAWPGPDGFGEHAILAELLPNGGIYSQPFTVRAGQLHKQAPFLCGPTSGCAVRLSKPNGPLVVCHGIESGLSLNSGILRGPHEVWAALSNLQFEHFELPAVPSHLIVAADGTEQIHAAAASLASRAGDVGWEVSLMAAQDGKTWNDVLRERTS
ncbi:toprim domain-containing protein [Roseobacter sp. MH60115]|uniref:toprim domain-containing protein n=1 Tax=Roseobacter sp. MH60115 TaxID=2785324 RepID=UPI0018A2808F|nr:toprim domain-containing protein [Roseobacter sp. MH60115]